MRKLLLLLLLLRGAPREDIDHRGLATVHWYLLLGIAQRTMQLRRQRLYLQP